VTKRICGLRKERLDRVTTVHLFPHLRQSVAVDDAKIAEIMKEAWAARRTTRTAR
jgi:hypothetical protein